MYPSRGKHGDAEEEMIQLQLPGLHSRLLNYSLRGMFDADEFGLFYRMPHTENMRPRLFPGTKRNKNCAVLLPCSNAEGSEGTKLLIIGHTQHHGFLAAGCGGEEFVY